MSARRESLMERDVVWAIVAIGTAVAAFAAAVLRFPFNHDVGALLNLTQRVLSGERLYVDIWEPNPPLVIWLFTPPVLIAKAIHVPITAVTQIWMVSFVLASLAVVDRVWAATQLVPSVGARRTLVIALAFLWLGVAPYEIGQRDPLALQLTAPYLFAAIGHACGRAPGRATSIATGVLATLGFALKPTFLPLLLIVEAYLYVAARRHEAWRRVEVLIICGGLGLFGAFVVLASGYLGAVRSGGSLYSAYENGFREVFKAGVPALWIAALVILAAARRSLGTHVRALLAIGLLVCVASALMQAKGWSYHWMPAYVSALFVFVLASVAMAARASGSGRLVADGLAVLFAALFVWRVHDARASRTDPRWTGLRKLTAFVKSNAGGGPVAWFSTACDPVFPVLTYADLRLMMPGTWLLVPGIYGAEPPLASPFPYHDPSAMTAAEHHVLDTTWRAFAAHPPTLVIFDRRPFKQGFGLTTFDHYEYLRRDARFDALFKDYRLLASSRDLLVLAPPEAAAAR
jgi:hypothetical protein